MTELDFLKRYTKGAMDMCIFGQNRTRQLIHTYWTPEFLKNMEHGTNAFRHAEGCLFSLGTTADPLPADLRAKQQNVTSIACLWVDIDIVDSAAHKAGNLPKSVDEAMGLLPEKYPPSIIVSSGHGLHAYWLLKDPVIINDENRAEVINAVRKLQQIIRNNAVANGWKIDATADLSRILRVPYTWNFKDPENPMLVK